MLKNLQEIMGGDVGLALVRLWSDELSEAEAAAIHSRGQGDPQYRDDLDGLLAIFHSIQRLAGDRAMEEMAREHRLLLQERRAKRHLALGMAAGMLLAIGAVLTVFTSWRGSDDSHLQQYFTRIGEQQTIELDDGSVVTLNTGGQLVVDYSEAARRVLLERGEAYFEVTGDPERPFTVDLGVRSVTAVGTAFNIRKNPERYQVAGDRGRGGVPCGHGCDVGIAAAGLDGQARARATPRGGGLGGRVRCQPRPTDGLSAPVHGPLPRLAQRPAQL